MPTVEEYREYVLKACPVCRFPYAVTLGTLLYGCVQCRHVWYKDNRIVSHRQQGKLS
jgi:hypothetical protein